MGGSATRFIREEQDRIRKLQDFGVPAVTKSALEEYRERERFLNQAGIADSVQSLMDQKAEQYRQMREPLNLAMEKIERDNRALSQTFHLGGLASAQAFQEKLAFSIRDTVGPISDAFSNLMESKAFSRIAEQQAAMTKASLGFQDQMRPIQEALGTAFPSANAFSASLGVQSALADSLRRISGQMMAVDMSVLGGLRDSRLWEDLRAEYEIEEEASVSEVLLTLGQELDQSQAEKKTLSVTQLLMLLQFLVTLYTIYLWSTAHGYTPEDRARDDRDSARIERIEERQLEAEKAQFERLIAEASTLAELKRIDALPKAFVIQGANVRSDPRQSGERMSRLGGDTVLAIEERKGRWFRVNFNDPLTGAYREGWVWHGSIELMTEEED